MGELIIKYQHQEQYFTVLQEGKIVKIFKSCGPIAATHTGPTLSSNLQLNRAVCIVLQV